jgi:hypothetical protein
MLGFDIVLTLTFFFYLYFNSIHLSKSVMLNNIM